MIAGGCRCGAVRYTLATDTLPAVYCCHCLDCQTWSGSAFTQQVPTIPEAISATGPIAVYAMRRDDGTVSTQHLCGTCHTRLWNTNSKWPSLAVLRAGTLDDSAQLLPRMHIWTKRKQAWIVIDPAIPAYPEGAPPAAFVALMAR